MADGPYTKEAQCFPQHHGYFARPLGHNRTPWRLPNGRHVADQNLGVVIFRALRRPLSIAFINIVGNESNHDHFAKKLATLALTWIIKNLAFNGKIRLV
jgi:hypothetical protein